jgi:tetratricopeptide (TPR) repeat protein
MVIALDPGSYWHYIDRGRLFLLMGRKIVAEQDFLEAAEIDGHHFLAYVYLAGICYEDDRWSEALRYYRRLVALKSNYHFAYEPLGVLNYGFGNWDESIRYFEKAYAHQPTENAYLLLTALALKRQGKAHNAAEYLRENLHRISPTDWRYEVARFLMRPEYVSPVLTRVNKEKNPEEKKRMSFYIASQYLISGQLTAAKAILVDLTDNLHSRHIESILTQWEWIKLEKGS